MRSWSGMNVVVTDVGAISSLLLLTRCRLERKALGKGRIYRTVVHTR
jgi:hypothetical protein